MGAPSFPKLGAPSYKAMDEPTEIQTLKPGTSFRLPLFTGELFGTLLSLNPTCAEVVWRGGRSYFTSEKPFGCYGKDTVSLRSMVIPIEPAQDELEALGPTDGEDLGNPWEEGEEGEEGEE